MKQGDLVYFKKSKTSPKRNAAEYEYKGHGFGIMLGAISPGQKEPNGGILLQILGALGYIGFDDINEFLGEDTVKTLMQKFEPKYYGEIKAKTDEKTADL